MEDLRPETDSPMNIINGDALEFDIKENTSAPRQIISNLPYNVSVPLLIKWLQEIKDISAMTLMFQKRLRRELWLLHVAKIMVEYQLSLN